MQRRSKYGHAIPFKFIFKPRPRLRGRSGTPASRAYIAVRGRQVRLDQRFQIVQSEQLQRRRRIFVPSEFYEPNVEPTAADHYQSGRRGQRADGRFGGQPPPADRRDGLRPADAVQGQFADVQETARVFQSRSQFGAGLGRTHAAERARTVQPAIAVAAGDTRGKPADADATAQPGAIPSQSQVPVAAHAVRPQRARAHVGRGGRTVAGEPVEFQRVRFEKHVQPPEHRARRLDRPGSAAVQTSAAAATAAAIVVLRQRTLAGLHHADNAVAVAAQHRQQTAERRRPIRIRPHLSGVADAHRRDDGHQDADHAVAVPVPDADATEKGQIRERGG